MLFGLSLVGLAQFVVAIMLSFTSVVLHVELERWLPNLCRWLIHRWLGVEVPRPYRPKPAPPVRQPDGWYRVDDELAKHPFLLRYRRRTCWLNRDPATHRDHLWELLTPFTGGLVAALPVGLFCLAGFLPVWLAIPTALFGLAIGPIALELYGRWSVSLLSPSEDIGWLWRWGRERWHTGLRLSAAFGLSLVGLGYAIVNLLAIYPGLMSVLPYVTKDSRRLVNLRRRQIREWAGVVIDEPYRPIPPPPPPRPDGRYQFGKRLYDSPAQLVRMQVLATTVKDPATWRDLVWLVLDPFVSFLLGAVPVVAFLMGFFVYFWSWAWSWPLALFIHLDLRTGWAYLSDFPGWTWAPNWTSPIIGLAAAVLALLLARPLLRVYAQWCRLMLAPTKSAVLAQRVDQLTETRAVAVDAQAAELRRIERDLHDGAQARWVAMGLNLGAVDRLLDTDPAAARKLLASARESSAEALVELRRLVRGIHPPVLAERGLGDAIRALALDSALTVHVAVDLAGRASAPIEAAVYFAVNELLTNVAKHTEAKQASVDIRVHADRLRVTVVDDGGGGADPAKGTGLRGVERRLATFDGDMVLTSPPGGPTTVTLEVPCALSSPKTSPSSGTA
ncbi:histidine kinase [Kibdelosporangium lantanae]